LDRTAFAPVMVTVRVRIAASGPQSETRIDDVRTDKFFQIFVLAAVRDIGENQVLTGIEAREGVRRIRKHDRNEA